MEYYTKRLIYNIRSLKRHLIENEKKNQMNNKLKVYCSRNTSIGTVSPFWFVLKSQKFQESCVTTLRTIVTSYINVGKYSLDIT